MTGRTLTTETTMMIIEAARQAAQAQGLRASIAIVDSGANLLGFLRMDGAALATIDAACVKARTAARFEVPTRTFPALNPALAIPMLAGVNEPLGLFPGGIPLRAGGQMIGAIGVGGGTSEQDDAAAAAGAALLAAD